MNGHRTYLDVGSPFHWRERKPPVAKGHRKWLDLDKPRHRRAPETAA